MCKTHTNFKIKYLINYLLPSRNIHDTLCFSLTYFTGFCVKTQKQVILGHIVYTETIPP